MPDLEDTPIEGEPDTPVDGAQGATDTEAPPWGDDFDAGKAWNTITTQRESEKELKERLRRLEEDDEAFAELARKRGFEFADDEPEQEPEFEDDDPLAPVNEKLGEFEQWKAEQQQKEADALIRKDLDAISSNSDWDLDEKDRRWIVNEAAQNPKGFTRDALEQAHKEYIDRLEAIAARGVEKAKTPKKASARVPAGQAATGVKDVSDMTRRELDVHMAERARALEG